MAQHAFIIGGTGQIGRAVAASLLAAGWRVTISHRGTRSVPPELGRAHVVTLDRDMPGALAAALGEGADVVIDTVAFDAAHGGQLLDLQGNVGSFVVISSISVYCDAQGRTTPEANPNGSQRNIAGITNRAGNVLGLMPHPERASERILGSDDGRGLFASLLASVNTPVQAA